MRGGNEIDRDDIVRGRGKRGPGLVTAADLPNSIPIPAPAEAAFLAAIAVAQQQKARSFELRAALSLSKLYRACRRDADAHAVLGSALDGFVPTPEFPEIEEALALLAATEACAH